MIKFPQDRGQQPLIAHRQHASITRCRERLAVPIGDRSTCSLDHWHQSAPVPNFHIRFRDDVDLTKCDQPVRIAIATP